MISRAIIKQNAKAQLRNSIFSNVWLSLVLLFILEGAVLSVGGTATASIAAFIIYGSVSVGVSAAMLGVMRGNDNVFSEDLFSGFTQNFGRNFALGVLSRLFIFLWSLLFIIPGIVKSYAYSMAFYIAKDHPEYDWRTCLNESERITRGHKWELFILDISFIGWYFIGLLCLGIGMLWVAPYHRMSVTNYYSALLELDNYSFVPNN